jgi:hypothetical protein
MERVLNHPGSGKREQVSDSERGRACLGRVRILSQISANAFQSVHESDVRSNTETTESRNSGCNVVGNKVSSDASGLVT